MFNLKSFANLILISWHLNVGAGNNKILDNTTSFGPVVSREEKRLNGI